MNKEYLFKYRNDFLFKIVTFMFIFLYFFCFIFIYNLIKDAFSMLLFDLLILLIIVIWAYFVKKKLEVTSGKFIFKDEGFLYVTLKNTYHINYDEVEYIKKNDYIEDCILFKENNYQYIIKIKDAGCFKFNYLDDSLDYVIEVLASKCCLEIK